MSKTDKFYNLFKKLGIRAPLLIIISGPSGVGKDAVIKKLIQSNSEIYQVITATTRRKRLGEEEGIPYYFLSKRAFEEKIQRQQFLEWAKVYENYYGVPIEEVECALRLYKVVLIKVDVQGSKTIKKIIPDAIYIFLAPPSNMELVSRLLNRGNMSKADSKLRLEKSQEEIKYLPLFDYVIENRKDNLDYTVSQVEAIINAERCRVRPRIIRI